MQKFATNVKAGVVAVGSAIVLMTALSACNRTQSTEGLINEAKQYQQKGDFKAAIIQLKNAIQKNPEDAEVRFLLGTLYNDYGDFASADKELNKAIELHLSKDKVMPALSKAMIMLGQYQKLLDATQAGNGVTPNADIDTMRGTAFLALKKFPEAKDAFEQALKATPNYPEAMIGLARYALSQKDIDAARKYAAEAVDKNPNSAECWQFKADLLRAEGKTDEALAGYEHALSIKPNLTSSRLEKAYLEISNSKFDLAKADIDAAAKTTNNPLVIKYAQALLDHSQGKDQAALDNLLLVLKAAPEHMPSVLLAGIVQYTLGSTKQAEANFNTYVTHFPENVYARKMLASATLKNGQAAKALEILTPILKDSAQDAQLFSLAGDAYMQTRDYNKATEYYEKASAIAPQSAAIHTALGMSKLGQGENARALAELEAGAKMDTKSQQAGIMLVMTQLRLKDFDKAMTSARQLEKEQPNNPMVQNLIGGVYLGKKDLNNARASFEKALTQQPGFYPAIANLTAIDIQEKKPDQAKKRLEAALEKDKKNSQFMIALAGLALSQNNTAEATTWLERNATENADSVPAAITLGAHYLRLGDKQKALTLARKLVGTYPANPEVLNLLAQVQVANDDKDGALDSYQKIAALQPDVARHQLAIAQIQMARKDENAAYESLKKAVSIQPDYLDAELGQLTLDLRKSKFDEALMLAHQIQKQKPKMAVGFEAEANVYLAQKKFEPALKALDQGFALEKSNSLVIKSHATLRQMGKAKDADARTTSWLKEHPNDIPVQMYLANVFMEDKQNKQAITQYQNVLRLEAKNAAALNNLAWLYQLEKDPKAAETAQKALDLAPESPVVLDTVGWIWAEQGNTAKALPLLKKAADLAKDATEIHYHYAVVLAKSGDKATAKKELDDLLATGKAFPQSEDAKALLKTL